MMDDISKEKAPARIRRGALVDWLGPLLAERVGLKNLYKSMVFLKNTIFNPIECIPGSMRALFCKAVGVVRMILACGFSAAWVTSELRVPKPWSRVGELGKREASSMLAAPPQWLHRPAPCAGRWRRHRGPTWHSPNGTSPGPPRRSRRQRPPRPPTPPARP